MVNIMNNYNNSITIAATLLTCTLNLHYHIYALHWNLYFCRTFFLPSCHVHFFLVSSYYHRPLSLIMHACLYYHRHHHHSYFFASAFHLSHVLLVSQSSWLRRADVSICIVVTGHDSINRKSSRLSNVRALTMSNHYVLIIMSDNNDFPIVHFTVIVLSV